MPGPRARMLIHKQSKRRRLHPPTDPHDPPRVGHADGRTSSRPPDCGAGTSRGFPAASTANATGGSDPNAADT